MEQKSSSTELRELLGKSFTGTLITDERMDPYFIIISDSGYSVNKMTRKKSGGLGYIAEGYYNNMVNCLIKISKLNTNIEGKHYTSLDEYMKAWSDNIEKLRQLDLKI